MRRGTRARIYVGYALTRGIAASTQIGITVVSCLSPFLPTPVAPLPIPGCYIDLLDLPLHPEHHRRKFFIRERHLRRPETVAECSGEGGGPSVTVLMGHPSSEPIMQT